MSKAEAPVMSTNGRSAAVASEDNDISMQDEFKSAASDIKMQSAADSSNENVSAAKEKPVPNSTSNTEEDWRRLKQQNVDLNNEIRTVDAQQTLNS